MAGSALVEREGWPSRAIPFLSEIKAESQAPLSSRSHMVNSEQML